MRRTRAAGGSSGWAAMRTPRPMSARPREAAGLVVRELTDAVLREEAGAPVPGLIGVLAAP